MQTDSRAAQETEIAVIGAGVVGHSVALRLAEAGHEVVMIAPAALGDGAAYGNAGVIADNAVLPAAAPDLLRALPALLLDRQTPRALRRAALPTLAPWLLRFIRRSVGGGAGSDRRGAQAIATLMADAVTEWDRLAHEIGAEALLHRRGALYLYETSAALAAAQTELALRRVAGLKVELIDPAGIKALEPGLPAGVAVGAALFPDTLTVSDPGAMLVRLTAAVARLGVTRIVTRAEALRRRAGGVELEGPGLRLRARRVVIAAGASSRPLALAAGDRVPLEAERGYHLEYDMPDPVLTRPTSPVGRGFHFCPLAGRLRVAGRVEVGALNGPPEPHRLGALEDGARAILPDLPAPDRSWMGLRPSVPDSVPVIGPSRGGPEVLLAFGHGHLGLTLAPITARIIAAMVAGEAPPVPVAAFRPARF